MSRTSSLLQAEHDGALAVFPVADLWPAMLRRATDIWWRYATRGKVRPQDVPDRIQDTCLEWWSRLDQEHCSRPRAASLLRYAVASVWATVIADRDPATNAVLPDYATKPEPTEYLPCKSRPCDLVAAVQSADARREARRQDLLSRATDLPCPARPLPVHSAEPSDHVPYQRQSVRIVQTGDAASAGMPGTLRMTAAWRRVGTGCSHADRPAAVALPHGVASVQVLPGVDAFPGVYLFAPADREDRQAYAAWLAVFAR